MSPTCGMEFVVSSEIDPLCPPCPLWWRVFRRESLLPLIDEINPEPTHIPELVVPPLQPHLRIERHDLREHLIEHSRDVRVGRRRIRVRVADWLRDAWIV